MPSVQDSIYARKTSITMDLLLICDTEKWKCYASFRVAPAVGDFYNRRAPADKAIGSGAQPWSDIGIDIRRGQDGVAQHFFRIPVLVSLAVVTVGITIPVVLSLCRGSVVTAAHE